MLTSKVHSHCMPMKQIKSPGKPEMTFFSARVPAAVWRRAQRHKLESGMTLEKIVAAALDAYLPKEKGGRNV